MAHDHEEIRAVIVEAARDIFSRYGYKKTTLDDIASSLHRVKSSLYYYFKNKEDLFRAVIEYEADRARKMIHDAVNRETTPEAKLRTYFNTMLVFINETMNYYKLLQEDMFDVLSFAEEEKKKHEKESVQFITSILDEGIVDGTFAISDVSGTVDALQNMFDGLLGPYHRNAALTEKKLTVLLNVLFNGIMTK